jgi:hypothetical protein
VHRSEQVIEYDDKSRGGEGRGCTSKSGTQHVACFFATVFGSSKVSTSSICGYYWHRSTTSSKPSPLSAYLCACPAGTYCPSNALAASSPLTCTAGSYCPKGSTSMTPCPSGYYCPSPSSGYYCPAGFVKWDSG